MFSVKKWKQRLNLKKKNDYNLRKGVTATISLQGKSLAFAALLQGSVCWLNNDNLYLFFLSQPLSRSQIHPHLDFQFLYGCLARGNVLFDACFLLKLLRHVLSYTREPVGIKRSNILQLYLDIFLSPQFQLLSIAEPHYSHSDAIQSSKLRQQPYHICTILFLHTHRIIIISSKVLQSQTLQIQAALQHSQIIERLNTIAI